MSDELREFDKTQEQPHVLRAELDRVKSEAAELRSALKSITPDCFCERIMDWKETGLPHAFNCPVYMRDAALSTTAGSDYVSKAEVRQIAEALQRMDSLLEKMFAVPWGKNFNIPTQEINEAFAQSRKALGVAREHGLLEGKQ